MPLILAIEPDHRQAAQLSVVIRRRLGAELILVDTTQRALDAIGNRVPDLLLVPALLSPQDDAALATALRVIAAATHVQILTTPVLAAPRPAARSGGMLASLLGDRSRPVESDGCDPTVFAEQVASYLERAAQERASALADAKPLEPEASAPLAEATRENAITSAPLADAATPDVRPTVEDTIPNFEEAAVPTFEEQVVPTFEEAVPTLEEQVVPTFEEAVAPTLEEQVVPTLDQETFPTFEEVARVEAVAAPDVTALEAVSTSIQDVREEAAETLEDVALGERPLSTSSDESVGLALEEAVRALFSSPGTAAPPALDLLSTPTIEPPPARPVEGSSPLALDEFMAVLEEMPLPAIEATEGGDWAPSLIEESDGDDIDLSAEIEDTAATSKERDSDVVELEAVQAEVVQLETAEAVVHLETTEAEVVHMEAAEADVVPLEAEEADFAELKAAVAEMLPDVEVAEPDHRSSSEEALDGELWMALQTASAPNWPGLEGLPAESASAPVPAVARSESAPPQPAKGGREWVELIESLRHDVERLRTERTKPVQEQPEPEPSPKRSDKKTKPVQDEWGFFDPEQCGFAALLAKLEEVTDSEEISQA